MRNLKRRDGKTGEDSESVVQLYVGSMLIPDIILMKQVSVRCEIHGIHSSTGQIAHAELKG